MKKKLRKGNRSLKVKLALIIICILSVVSISLTTVIVRQARERLIDEAKASGMGKVYEISDQIDFSQEFEAITDEVLSDKVTSIAYLIGQREVITSEYLMDVSKKLNISEINVADASRKIIYSNMAENLDYVYSANHALAPVFKGDVNFISEPIRESSVDNKEYKYGGARLDNGYVVQVGIHASVIEDLRKSTNYQAVINQSITDASINYALIIDLNSTAIAHNIIDRVGLDLSEDSNVQKVLQTQEATSSEFDWNYEGQLIHTYDCLVPLFIDDEFVGVINAGISLEQLDQDIQAMRIQAAITALILTLLSAVIVYMSIHVAIKPLNQLAGIAKHAASGDLKQTIPVKSRDEVGQMSQSFKDMIVSLRSMIADINKISGDVFQSTASLADTATQVTQVTEQIALATQDVAKGADTQVQHINDASRNLDNVLSNVELVQNASDNVLEGSNNNFKTVQEAQIKVQHMSQQMEKIQASVAGASLQMQELGQIADQIGSIIDIINGIAEQTNLLALNASIEAARAGEHGRGFAVVADEIRKLAEESRSSTENIRLLIEKTQLSSSQALSAIQDGHDESQRGSQILMEVSNSFNDIESGVTLTKDNMMDLKDKTNHINNAVDEVKHQISMVEEASETSASNAEEVAASTEEQTASVEEIAATIHGLEEMMRQLKESVGEFNI
jgi:methyl-accepting chemotaxis protein